MSVLAKNIISLFFFLGSLAYVYLKLEGPLLLEYISKYVIIAFVSLYYLVRKTKTNYLFLVIIIFQMIGDITVIKQQDHEGFMMGVPFFFIVNILLVYLILQNITLIKLKRIFIFFVFSVLTVLLIVYFVFSKVGLMLFLVVSFSVMEAILITITVYYFKVNENKTSSGLLFMSMFLLLLVYVFGGFTRLIKPIYFFKLIVAVSYIGHLFCLTKYVLFLEKETSS